MNDSLQLSPLIGEILRGAKDLAVNSGSSFIGTEHFLLSILQHKNNNAYAMLEKQIVPAQLEMRLKEIIKRGSAGGTVTLGNLPLTSSLQHSLYMAQMEAGNTFVEPIHILVSIARNKDSLAGKLLAMEGFSETGTPNKKQGTSIDTSSETPALDNFGVDLTKLAGENKLDPVIGREAEIDRVIQILNRRKKNNPALIGDPGVGKTAIVEGIAQRITNGSVPEALKGKRLIALNLNAIVAGTKFRGQFEERMQSIINEVVSNKDIILFIDELHGLVGTGGVQGAGDSAEILKPALAKGDLQCIGATTLDDYRKYIEKDGALERRFQKVIVDATSEEETLEIIRKIKPIYETFHGVKFDDAAIDATVNLSNRYITDRQFPDKAVDVLDEAGSKAKLAKVATIDTHYIREIVSKMSGVPITTLGKSERDRLRAIEEGLSKKVIGQPEAISLVAQAIKRGRTGMKTKLKPDSFIFLGPTGVGKTELAKRLAEFLFDSPDALIRFDMSEYMEKFSVSTLIGAPPGYIGYENGGQLTERVRRRPYCVVLFDEIEKAHPDIFNILLQVLDDGVLTDASGRDVNFKNTILIMTSNLGAEILKKNPFGFTKGAENSYDMDGLVDSAKRYFRAEFINRLDGIITFNALTKGNISDILDLYLNDFDTKYKITLTPEAREYFVENGYSTEYGARPLRRLIQDKIEAPIADILLEDPSAKEFSVSYDSGKVIVTKQIHTEGE